MNKENNIAVNQAKPENNGAASGITFDAPPVEKVNYRGASIKGLMATQEMQEAIRRYVSVPEILTIKQVKNPFENKETKVTTQKVEAMSGTTVEDAAFHELTLVDTELDPVKAINKKYRLLDFMFALDANMKSGKFTGYAATGLKLMVTRLEEVK